MVRRKVSRYCLLIVVFILSSTHSVAGPPPIIQAVKNRDLSETRALIAGNVDVNAPQADGATALHWAVHSNDLEIVHLLLEAGAQVDATNDFGINPIWLSCENRNAGITKLLLEAGADPNGAILTGETLLMTASHFGSIDIVRLLLEAGAEVNVTEPVRSQTPLMWAIGQNHIEIAFLLLKAGSNIHAQTTFGFTPLMFAARNGETEIARALLDRGADVNAASTYMGTNLYLRPGVTEENKNDPGYNVLQIAVHRGHGDIVELLLERGADPNYDKLGFTALLWACGSWESALDGVAGINAPKDSEWYHMGGLRDDRKRIIKALLEYGADPNALLKDNPTRFGFAPRLRPIGSTSYVLAALAGDAATMRLLVENGADPTLLPETKIPAILYASGYRRLLANSPVTEEQCIEAVQAALDSGAAITDTDADGNTVLHGAAYVRFPNLIQFLVDQGADLYAKNSNRQNPEYVASRQSRGVGEGEGQTASPALKLIRKLSKPATLTQSIEEWGEMQPHIRNAVEFLLQGELKRISEAAAAEADKKE
jgi:ankyrin repeat protein